MTTSEMIKVLCVRMGISVSELARRIDQSPQNFSAKLKRDSVTRQEIKRIADVMSVDYEQSFILPNGEKITAEVEHEL